ncbi:hypothetical protein YC2023_092240 [Brassica napus]
MTLDDVKAASKRKSDPGVRVIGGRIYDSSNGRCCHQVRTTITTLILSDRFSLDQYGEKAEEVGALVDWRCPKCRGICNCSFCRKKRGQSPTGILTHKAKASGLSSVSELLEVEGHDTFSYQKKKPKLVLNAPFQENVSNGGRSCSTD